MKTKIIVNGVFNPNEGHIIQQQQKNDELKKTAIPISKYPWFNENFWIYIANYTWLLPNMSKHNNY